MVKGDIVNIASWVQAVASVALIVVTIWYVRLTHNLSATAEKQLSAMQHAEELRRRAQLREFAYLTKRLVESVRALPLNNTIQHHGPLIAAAALWSSDDLAYLGQLAARSGESYAADCVQPLIDLEWLRDRAQAVKTVIPGTRSALADMPWEDWYTRHQRTLSALDALHSRSRIEADASPVAQLNVLHS